MNKQELKNKIIELQQQFKSNILSKYIKKYYLNELINLTSFLPENIQIQYRIHCILNNTIELPLCKCGCNQRVNNPVRSYLPKHGNSSREVKLKKQQNYKLKTGFNNPSQNPDIKKKKTQTIISNFGTIEKYKQHVKDTIKETHLEKYGVDNVFKLSTIKEKIKQTHIDRYGKLFNNREKAKQTCQGIYGTDYPLQNKEIQEKAKQTNLRNLGVEYPTQNKEVREKVKQTFLNKYGTIYPLNLKEIQVKVKRNEMNKTYDNFKRFNHIVIPLFTREQYIGSDYHNIYKWECTECKTVFESYYYSRIPRCSKCYPNSLSTHQKLITNFISKYFQVESCNRSIIAPLELDIYILNKKIAIEIDGIYWHSELNGVQKDYHINKTNLCKEKDIQLIHIFDDEIVNKPKIVESILKHKLNIVSRKIYARKCVVRKIDYKTRNKFIEKYHIQGDSIGTCIDLGLFYKNRLVSVMTFSKLRKSLGHNNQIDEYELNRYCTINNFTIIGAAGKLLSYFEKNYKPKSIISYADRRWSNGNLYYKLGFQLDHISDPNYWYFKDNYIREHRFKYRKSVLVKQGENTNLTEWEIMQKRGYNRVWDCGNLVFRKNF